MQNAKIFQQLCEQHDCTKFVELLFGKKQCNSFDEIRCDEAMKKVPPKRYHRTDNSLTLHVKTCCYQLRILIIEDLLIVLQLQSLDMNPIWKYMAEWHGGCL